MAAALLDFLSEGLFGGPYRDRYSTDKAHEHCEEVGDDQSSGRYDSSMCEEAQASADEECQVIGSKLHLQHDRLRQEK